MKKSTVVFFVIIMAVIAYTYLGFYYCEPVWYILMTSIMMFIVLCILFGLFFKRCMYWYTTFMINDKNTFQGNLDKPRVFLFSIFFPIMIIAFYSFKNFDGFSLGGEFKYLNEFFNFLCLSSLLGLFIVSSILLFFTFTKKFEFLFLPRIKEVVRKLDRDFKSDMELARAGIIFERLVKSGFMGYEDYDEQIESKNTFLNIFVQGKLPEQVCFKLAMDNIQTHCFYELLKKEVNDLGLNHLLKIFRNKNSKASAKSIRESVRKASNEKVKDRNEIELIFAES